MSAPPAVIPRANMGTAVSKRKTLRNEAMSSVAAKVRWVVEWDEGSAVPRAAGRFGSVRRTPPGAEPCVRIPAARPHRSRLGRSPSERSGALRSGSGGAGAL